MLLDTVFLTRGMPCYVPFAPARIYYNVTITEDMNGLTPHTLCTYLINFVLKCLKGGIFGSQLLKILCWKNLIAERNKYQALTQSSPANFL